MLEVKKAALYWANEISYWLRLQIKPEQTPVEICNKLIRKLGLEAVAIARPGRRGEKRDQVWSVSGQENSTRQRLLEALRHKLSKPVSSICIDQKPRLQINDTASQPPSHQGFEVGGVCRRSGSISEWVIEAVEGATARIRQSDGWASNITFEVPIAELRAIA